ncbi:MAG: hypothetical protein HQL35_01005 [Alphaproteobacteria bacterium]|nr:hypothetical protein [Alphaproteobacteria bacterium]
MRTLDREAWGDMEDIIAIGLVILLLGVFVVVKIRDINRRFPGLLGGEPHEDEWK